MIKVAINGFGRIGRLTLRNLLKNPEVDVVAINDLTDPATLGHLFKFDTAQGMFPDAVSVENESLKIGNHTVRVTGIKNPEELPWKELQVDVVLECTGVFRTRETAQKHIQAGAKKVIISAPAKDSDIPFIVLGVNNAEVNGESDIISNASCTTNCLAPVVKLIDEKYEIKNGFITTTHGYTADQRLQDSPHSDLRRARAAAQNIIPTSTGAASAVGVVIPRVKGKLHATALRVPVITGSLIELTCNVGGTPSVDEINSMFKSASESTMSGILEYNDSQVVSSDIIGNTHSSIFDAPLTQVDGQLVKLVSWYDNEAGYAARMADLTIKMKDFI